jgi:hypothetical protein
MSRERTLVAFLVAPLIVPFVFYLPFPGRTEVPGKASALELLLSPLIYSIAALPIAYAAELMLGVPAWKIFRRYGVRSLTAFAAAGALLGWLVNLALQVQGWLVTSALRIPRGDVVTSFLAGLFNPFENPYISICIVAGSSSAVLFRIIVFSGGPARDNRK